MHELLHALPGAHSTCHATLSHRQLHELLAALTGEHSTRHATTESVAISVAFCTAWIQAQIFTNKSLKFEAIVQLVEHAVAKCATVLFNLKCSNVAREVS